MDLCRTNEFDKSLKNIFSHQRRKLQRAGCLRTLGDLKRHRGQAKPTLTSLPRCFQMVCEAGHWLVTRGWNSFFNGSKNWKHGVFNNSTYAGSFNNHLLICLMCLPICVPLPIYLAVQLDGPYPEILAHSWTDSLYHSNYPFANIYP